MRWLLLVAVSLCFTNGAVSQTKKEAQQLLRNLEGDATMYDGHIILSDGSEEDGTITYNDRTGVVSFKSDSKTGTYNARNLNGFDIYDPETHEQRSFFSMDYEMRDGGQKVGQFFEIVRQYKDFAVLVKTDPLTFDRKISLQEAFFLGTYEGIQNRMEVIQVMTVYLISEDLGVRPYMEYQTKEVKHVNQYIWSWHFLDGKFTKLKILDRRLPKELMGASYDKVDDYADANNLEWNVKDDLVKILEYYDTLMEN